MYHNTVLNCKLNNLKRKNLQNQECIILQKQHCYNGEKDLVTNYYIS